jgi:hypothetical protein
MEGVQVFDLYLLILVGVSALLMCFGFVYLSPFGLWLGMAKVQLDLERQASIISIRRVSTILTPVLLGILLSRLDHEITSLVDMIAIVMFLLWIVSWLYFQRMPAVYLELIHSEKVALSARRLVLQLIFLFCIFYYPWLVTWYPNTAFGLMGVVFIVDLVLQALIITLMLQERRGHAH